MKYLQMKIHLAAIISIVFIFLLVSASAIAEDSSCELKDENAKNMTQKSGNEFTHDKTWHFKADSILMEKEVFSDTDKKKDKSNPTNTSALKI